MGLKTKLGLGVSTAALGLSLIGGGTFAYFSDEATATSSFSAGTLDLSTDPEIVLDVTDLKPGDTMTRPLDLVNGGTLDIGEITMDTSYNVDDADNNNNTDFGEHIRVNFLFNADKVDAPIYSTTLSQLQTMEPDAIEGNIFSPWLGESGGLLEAQTSDQLYVQFEFVDNDQDQNEYQGDSLDLTWTFEAMQTEGEAK